MYGCDDCNSWCQGYKSCTSCGDESYTDPRWGYPNPGQCNACGDNFRLLKGDEADNINQQSGTCAPVCGADQYLENSVCVAKKKAGEYCWDNYYYGPGYGPGGEETERDNPMCASGKCGGPSSNNYMMSMSPYCCADPTCEKPCDQGTGACTTKSMPGEACSTKDDCYGEHACLGGKCCSFTHSEYTQSSNDPYMYMYSYNNERISKCTACGGTDEKDRYGSDRPGQCVSCAAGYRLLTGKETDVNNGWESGVCGPTCNSTSYLDAGMWPMQCVTKTDAGKYCHNPWPYYDPMTASGAANSQPLDNFNTGGFMCKSGLCGGGGANSMSMSMSMSYCSYDPMTGYAGDQNYCCNDAAKAAGCKKPCDKTTGACTTKSMPGETCTSSADCFNDRACIGGRCCSFAACDHTAQAPPPPPPGGYDPYGGMYYYEDNQRYRYRSCNQCSDTEAKDHNGVERPGMCTSCGGDERLLIGDPKEESTYWDAGVCAPKCAEGEYFEGGMFKCQAKNKAGTYCWSHYQWDPITGEAMDIGGFMCTSGVCGSTVKDPFSHMGGMYMMGNEYCCNADAVKEVDGQCCGRCKQGSGECLEWEKCPAPPSEDMSAAQAAAATIIGSIKDEKQKKKAEKLTVAAMAGDDIHKLAGKLKESSGDAAIKTFYKNAAIDEKHGAAVATSLDAGWNQFLNPGGGRRRLLAQYEFKVEVFFTETEVKDNSISLRTASTNLETSGVSGVTMQEDVDPIKELKTMGVDSEKLENFEKKAKKSSAEVQSKRAIAPPPPSPPPRKLVEDEDGAPSIRGGVVLSCVIALAATALFA